MNQNLRLRIMTALIGVPLILILLLFCGVEGISFLAWVISMAMLFEFSKMFLKLQDAKFKIAVLLIFNTGVHGLHYWSAVGLNSTFLGIAPVFFGFVFFLFLVPRLLNFRGAEALETEAGLAQLQQHVRELMALTFGFVYCGWFPLLMVNIRQLPQGKHWLLLALIVVWASDTFAYFAGKFFGKKPFFPSVSPKKTWEGAIGGTLGAVILAIVYASVFIPGQSLVEIAVIALTVSVASAMGDLSESLIKRAAQVKDSGSLLPGHGGVLDRFDGVLFALPVMSAFLWFIF